MDPKNVDRVGKGFLAIVVAAVGAAAKKYGPTIVKGAGKVISKLLKV